MFRDRLHMAALAALLLLLLCAGCEKRSAFMGKYTAEGDEDGAVPTVILELKDGGQGSWVTEDETVPFRWDAWGDEVRLYTKAGGIVQGRVLEGSISVHLPGAGVVLFQRNVQ